MMDGAVLKMIRVALEIMSMRSLTVLAMAMSFLLACWVMWMPTWERMAMASFFAVCVYLPCINWERKQNEAVNQKD